MGEKTKLNARRFLLVGLDIISILIAAYGSLFLRFNGPIDPMFLSRLNNIIILLVLIDISIFVCFRLYHSLWQFASITELKNIIIAAFTNCIINTVVCELTGNGQPKSCYIIFF